jgi:hypothetical protein
MTHPEADLQIQVADLLRIYERQRHFIWFSTPNELLGSARSEGGLGRMVRFKRMGLRAGVADIVLVCHGHAYFVELKTKTGRQSESQRQFEDDVSIAGGCYTVSHSLDEAIDALKIWGIIP